MVRLLVFLLGLAEATLYCTHGVSHILPFYEHTTSVEGYIMDQYCINLGYLLDNPSVVTLENPGAHSLHWYVGDQL